MAKPIQTQPTFTAGLNSSMSATLYLLKAKQAYAEKNWSQACSFAQACIAAARNEVVVRNTALNLLGTALMTLQHIEQALPILLELNKSLPNDANNLINIGNILAQLHRNDEAIKYLQQAIVIAPQHAEAHAHLGFASYRQGDLNQAITCYQQALTYNPKSPDSLLNLAIATHIKGRMLQDDTLIAEAYQAFERIVELETPHSLTALSGMLYMQHYEYPLNMARQYAIAKRYGEQFKQSLQSIPQQQTHSYQSKKPLNVGIISSDFREHAVGYFLESVLEHMSTESYLSNQISLVAYHNHKTQDQYTQRFKVLFNTWHQVEIWSDDQLIRQIKDDHIDILIDLSGHTDGNRLPVFAQKPAPLQVSWLGYFGSTGLPTIDFVLADPISVPADEEKWFVEKIWQLPHLRYCFSIPHDAPDISIAPCTDKPEIVFGCYQALAKINQGVLHCWSRILHNCPHARLRIQSKGFAKPEAKARFIERLNQVGINIQQIIFAEAMDRRDYLASYSEVDILLDTFPFPGGTTTAEALWMGIPTITLAVPSMLGRQGEALMVNAGLTDWVTHNDEDYVQKATSWGNANLAQRQKLAVLRSKMREQVRLSPVFDAKHFAHDFVNAMHGMWQEKFGIE